jgi:FAD:protein FMN transferase
MSFLLQRRRLSVCFSLRFVWSVTLLAVSLHAETPPAAAALSRYEFVAPHMGTLFRIVLFAGDPADAQDAAKAAFARIAELDRLLSDYVPTSEIRRLEQPPPGTAIAASPEVFDLLHQSQRLAEQSAGAFDVTLGPVVRLWREARRTRRLPTEIERATALGSTGYSKLHLNSSDRTVTLHAPGMRLDLGGIAKGYAADAALAVLAQRGITRALVAASGDLALGDGPPDAPGWRMELAPFGQRSTDPVIVIAANVGISTSGGTEQFVEIDGIRYSHLVDPATGIGLTHSVAVSVIARNATQSDSLATACSILASQGEAFTGCLGDSARAIILRRDESGRIQRAIYGSSPPGLYTKL